MPYKGPKILRIEPVVSPEGLRILEALAREIWLEDFVLEWRPAPSSDARRGFRIGSGAAS